jgi:hypothetical protein
MESRELTASYLLEKAEREDGRWSSLLPWSRLCAQQPTVHSTVDSTVGSNDESQHGQSVYPHVDVWQSMILRRGREEYWSELPLLTQEYLLENYIEDESPRPCSDVDLRTYLERLVNPAQYTVTYVEDFGNPRCPRRLMAYTPSELVSLLSDPRLERITFMTKEMPTQFAISNEADEFYREWNRYGKLECLKPKMVHTVQNEVIGKKAFSTTFYATGMRWRMKVLAGCVYVHCYGLSGKQGSVLGSDEHEILETFGPGITPGYSSGVCHQGFSGSFHDWDYILVIFMADTLLQTGYLLTSGEAPPRERTFDLPNPLFGPGYDEFLRASKLELNHQVKGGRLGNLELPKMMQ